MLDDIYIMLFYGIWVDNDDMCFGDMLFFGIDELFSCEEISQVFNYVVLWVGLEIEDGVDFVIGEMFYVDNCVVCYGDNLEGIQEMGVFSLMFVNYFYGKLLEDIKVQVYNVCNGVMFGWIDWLDEVMVKLFVVYVYLFGGGQQLGIRV